MKLNDTSKDNKIIWENCDLLVKAWVPRTDIQMLVKYVEGVGHLGVVTTTDRLKAEVVIQTTKQCWPDLKKILEKLPIVIELMS